MESAADAKNLFCGDTGFYSLPDDPLHIGLPHQGFGNVVPVVRGCFPQQTSEGARGILILISCLFKVSFPEGVVILAGEGFQAVVDTFRSLSPLSRGGR